jgi:hypothetical protein
LSQQESEDSYDVVQWAAGQPWSDGRVVMLGVSYLAMSQYGPAGLHPPSLRAICPWEGFTDAHRDVAFPGGIREKGFMRVWMLSLRRITRMAYDLSRMQDAHRLRDEFWRSLVPDLSAIRVPMLVCGSFSDHNLHSSSSMRAFTHAASTHARLYTHRGGKWATFYSEPARAEQLAFIRAALDGAPDARSVRLEVREDRDTVAAVREGAEWPLARTRWRPLYLTAPGVLDAQADGRCPVLKQREHRDEHGNYPNGSQGDAPARPGSARGERAGAIAAQRDGHVKGVHQRPPYDSCPTPTQSVGTWTCAKLNRGLS